MLGRWPIYFACQPASQPAIFSAVGGDEIVRMRDDDLRIPFCHKYQVAVGLYVFNNTPSVYLETYPPWEAYAEQKQPR